MVIGSFKPRVVNTYYLLIIKTACMVEEYWKCSSTHALSDELKPDPVKPVASGLNR